MMSSSLKKKLLPAAMAVAMASGALISSNANAIHVNEKGIGQVLMSPLYLAEFGYNSKVTIVNTRSDVAVKTRVVLRSHVNSIEFDFVCYMTPSDVCRFEIVRGDDGQAYIKSDDDSILADEPTNANNYQPIFASQCATENGAYCKDGFFYFKVLDDRLPTNTAGVITNAPVAENFVADAHPSNPDSNEIGHLDIIGIWAAKGSIRYNSITDAQVVASQNGASPLRNRVLIEEGMSKVDLYKIMGPVVPDTATGQGVRQNRDRLSGYDLPIQDETLSGFAVGRLSAIGECQEDPILTSDLLLGSSIVNAANYGEPCIADNTPLSDSEPGSGTFGANGSKIRSTDPRWVRLMASVEMESTVTGDRMGLQMTALDGDVWDNLMPSDHLPAYGMFSHQPSIAQGAIAVGPFGYAFDGRVISNPRYELDTSNTMLLGVNFGGSRTGIGATSTTYDNIVEIENALASSKMATSYENDGKNLTNLIVTFPTKYRHMSEHAYFSDTTRNLICDKNGDGKADAICIDNSASILDLYDHGDVCASELTAPGGNSNGNATLYDGRFYYPPFRAEESGSVVFGLSSLDNQEHRVSQGTTAFPIFSGFGSGPQSQAQTITDEVNYMWINWPFASGWSTLTMTPVLGCQYSGVPVLAYAHKTQRDAEGNFINSWLSPLSKDSSKDTLGISGRR